LDGDRGDLGAFASEVERVQLQAESGEVLPDLGDVVDIECAYKDHSGQPVGDRVGQHVRGRDSPSGSSVETLAGWPGA